MKHLLHFKLFETPLIGDIMLNNPFGIPKREIDVAPISSIIISDEMNDNNKFDIEYNSVIKILYNDTEKHVIFGEHRLFDRTSFLNTSEFNIFIKNAFRLLYPIFFFDNVDSIDDIDVNNPTINQRNNKTYVLDVYDTNRLKGFSIPYTISKKYNEYTNKYDFFIYIITITPSSDNSRIYTVFNIDFNSNTNQIDLISYEKIGIKPHINTETTDKIKRIQMDELLSFKYYKAQKKEKKLIDDKILNKPINKPIKKEISKLLKKR